MCNHLLGRVAVGLPDKRAGDADKNCSEEPDKAALESFAEGRSSAHTLIQIDRTSAWLDRWLGLLRAGE
jgi:hypothetical protein